MTVTAESISAVENLALIAASEYPSVDFFLTVHPHDADGLIYVIADSPMNATVFDVLHLAREKYCHVYFDDLEVTFVSAITSKRLNVDEVRKSDKNLFNRVDVSDWRYGYYSAVSEVIAAKGAAVKWGNTYYGWMDYETHQKYAATGYPVAVILEIKEDHWDEFEGTFATEDSRHHGYTMHAILEDGTQLSIRYEDSTQTLMQEILSR